jgi:hypothetical protein
VSDVWHVRASYVECHDCVIAARIGSAHTSPWFSLVARDLIWRWMVIMRWH